MKEQREIRKQQFYGSYKQVQKILRIVNHHIVLRMKEEQNSSNVLEVSLVINQYYSLSRMLRSRSVISRRHLKNGQHTNELVPEIQRELKLEGLYTQRSVLDELIKRNKITNEVATQIRENINYNEIVLSHESDE